MKRLLFSCLITFALYSCARCHEVCLDEGVHIRVQNMQAVDTDTVYLIKYKPNTGFAERIDTIKRYINIPVGSTLPSTFFDILDYKDDWKVVIPAVNKEYFISNIETGTASCSCEPGNYKTVKKFRFNNSEKEGNDVVLQ
jgi:hypothetical protein